MHISLASEPVFVIGSFVVTNSLLSSMVATLILVSVGLFVGLTVKIHPKGLQNLLEILVDYFDSLVSGFGGKESRKYLPLIITIFLYVLLTNWLGIFPFLGAVGINEVKEGHVVFTPLFRGATADINTTLALAIVSFFSIQFFGISTNKLGYFKKFLNFKNPIFFFSGLLEIVSELSKIISFAFRLFGNIFAGEVLLAVITALVPVLLPLPFIGLEIFVGLIQAYVFAVLTAVFINVSTQSHGEEVAHGN